MTGPGRRYWRWRAARIGLGLVLAGAGVAWLLPGVLMPWLAQTVVGAEAPATTAAPATLATFAEIPGVTQDYVNAYNLFIQAKHAGNPARNYTRAIAAYRRIAETSTNPELRLRACYFLTLCHFLEGDWSAAYAWSEKVLTQARALRADDPRVVFASRLAARAKTGEASLSDVRIALAGQLGADPSRLAADLNAWEAESRRLAPRAGPDVDTRIP